jgi:NifU-like protein involved in Fe-S cluster formation
MHSDNVVTIAEVLNSKKFNKKISNYDINYSPGDKCSCKNTSIISYYAKCENNTISEISYDCRNCDNLLRVVLELFCENVQGKRISSALNISSKEIVSDNIFSVLDESRKKKVKYYFNYAKIEFNKMIEQSKNPESKCVDSC